MISKIALFFASLAASLVLAAALALSGFAPGATPARPVAATSPDPTASASDLPAEPLVQVDTVYVAPPPKQKTVTIHKVVKASGGEPGESGEHESGD